MPPRVAPVQLYEVQYWADMINGTGDNYYVYPESDTTVNVFDYKQCVEVSKGVWGQWVGAMETGDHKLCVEVISKGGGEGNGRFWEVFFVPPSCDMAC